MLGVLERGAGAVPLVADRATELLHRVRAASCDEQIGIRVPGERLGVGAVLPIAGWVGDDVPGSEVGDVHVAGAAAVDAVDVGHAELLLEPARPVVLDLQVRVEAVDDRPFLERPLPGGQPAGGTNEIQLVHQPLAFGGELEELSGFFVAGLRQGGEGLLGLVVRALGEFDLAGQSLCLQLQGVVRGLFLGQHLVGHGIADRDVEVGAGDIAFGVLKLRGGRFAAEVALGLGDDGLSGFNLLPGVTRLELGQLLLDLVDLLLEVLGVDPLQLIGQLGDFELLSLALVVAPFASLVARHHQQRGRKQREGTDGEHLVHRPEIAPILIVRWHGLSSSVGVSK